MDPFITGRIQSMGKGCFHGHLSVHRGGGLPLEGVCLEEGLPGGGLPGGGRSPPTRYSQPAVSTHLTGMHSCCGPSYHYVLVHKSY